MFMKKHRERVLEILSEMFSIYPALHPQNQKWAARYIRDIYPRCIELANSLEPWGDFPNLVEKFQEFDDAENERLRKNLEDIKYDIDDLDTLLLIAGPGRAEKVGPNPNTVMRTQSYAFACCRLSSL